MVVPGPEIHRPKKSDRMKQREEKVLMRSDQWWGALAQSCINGYPHVAFVLS